METLSINEAASELLELFQLNLEQCTSELKLLSDGDSKYLRDLKMNIKGVLKSEHLTEKECALVALAGAYSFNNSILANSFKALATRLGSTKEETAEVLACTSLLSSNNVLYRFRHFTGKEKYEQLPARLRMSIMMNPVLGKEFFELISLAVSAVNGCEMCVNAHEHSLIELGTKEERIFDAIRIVSVISSLNKIIH